MKIALFGATGGTGREVLSQALENDIQVTACVRTPEKIADVTHPNLSLIQGDALDKNAVELTVANQEAVVSTLGAGAKRSSLREESTKMIIEAMETHCVKRLISLSLIHI